MRVSEPEAWEGGDSQVKSHYLRAIEWVPVKPQPLIELFQIFFQIKHVQIFK